MYISEIFVWLFSAAVKCNDDATILATLAELGTGFDCASKVFNYFL